METIMKLLEILTWKVMETKIWSVNKIGDEWNTLMMRFISSMMKRAYRNQGQNYKNAADGRDREREESINSKTEIMLEQILERVVSIDVVVRELKYDLLTLTQTVESHAISVRHLDERAD
ncbi:hypothetical protein HAX54_045437 [Datura stramonium]|uniref:Uncharacterized protein n=1 Tax=Datura stramonium TaxID=4076 RepID=A0ABS8WI09_DATST|nr:hypothetical protein [Datura stramonium]